MSEEVWDEIYKLRLMIVQLKQALHEMGERIAALEGEAKPEAQPAAEPFFLARRGS
jgi:hypothetical protein